MNDLINGLFEFGGAAALSFNLFRIMKDKMSRGVHWFPVAFFVSWGLWHLHYYLSLDQWWSFAAGTLIVTVNTFWLFLIWLYRRN